LKKSVTIIIGNSGVVCSNCQKLEANIKKVINDWKEKEIEFNLEHITITLPEVIAKFGTLMPPALIFDETVVSTGRIPNPKQISTALHQYIEKS